MLVGGVIPNFPGNALLTALFAACSLAALAVKKKRLRETTLLSAWWWSLGAISAIGAVEIVAGLLGVFSPTGLIAARYAAAVLLFCPVLAVLGAKRPQHLAWNFVTISLWAILILPAVEMLLGRRTESLTLGDARGWFLWALILLTPINFLPTRYWFAALVYTAAQIMALAPQLPLPRGRWIADHSAIAAGLLAASLLGASLVARRATVAASNCDRIWFDFRDSFGLLWALRYQERVNAAADAGRWGFYLSWNGLRRASDNILLGALGEEQLLQLRPTITGLLRRFVSNDWVAARLGDDTAMKPTSHPIQDHPSHHAT